MADTVLVARNDDVATVILNRPEKLNALSQAAWTALARVMHELSSDESLRCVIVRGAGASAFAAGADVSEFPEVRADAAQGQAYGGLIHAAMKAVGECTHPTIAMIHGVCVGGGLEIALMCDLRIASDASRFGIPVNRLGLTMGYGELEGLLSVAGAATALEILLEGRVFDAREALAKRLVNRIVPQESLEAEVGAAAARIAAGAPLVARWHKRFIRRLQSRQPLSEAEWAEGFDCFDSEDYREGLRAFLARETPHFKGQ